MKLVPKINRRVWVALDLQARRRKRRHPALKAPVLRAVYPDKLAWTWPDPNPFRWLIWMSNDNGGTWTQVSDYWTTGDDHDFWPDGGSQLYYVVGVDSAGNEVTGHSNPIRPDSALMPAPVLLPLYPDKLSWSFDLTNPARWNIWMSNNGGTSWTLLPDYWTSGAARQFWPDGGSELYYVVGVDALGNEITEHSNVARPDDALSMPTAIPNCQLWLRMESLNGYADGESVYMWPDDSGHERDLFQFTGDYQPVFRMNTVSQPSLEFDGVDDVMATSNPVFNTDQHTIFIVARPDSNGENDMLGTGGTGEGDVLMMIYSGAFRGHAWEGADLTVLDGGTYIDSTNIAVFEQRVRSSEMVLRLDGAIDASGPVEGTGTSQMKPVKIGSRDTGAYFLGHILSVVVYDRALTDFECEAVRSYLNAVYAVPVPYGA